MKKILAVLIFCLLPNLAFAQLDRKCVTFISNAAGTTWTPASAKVSETDGFMSFYWDLTGANPFASIKLQGRQSSLTFVDIPSLTSTSPEGILFFAGPIEEVRPVITTPGVDSTTIVIVCGRI